MPSLRHGLIALALTGALACSKNETGGGNAGNPSGITGSAAGTGAAGGGPAAAGSGNTTGGPAGTGGAGAGAEAGGTGGDGTAPSLCPEARPAESSACQAHTMVCTYDEIECRCPSGTWSCAEPVDPNCPADKPMHGAACTAPEATECDFLDDECECLSGLWSCDSAVEDAGMPSDAGPQDARCPMARPAEDSTCQASDVSCTYDQNTCTCPSGTWMCNEPVDPGCPATAPATGSTCTGAADCDFAEVECECLSSIWDCKPNE